MPDATETIAALLHDHRPRGKNQGYPEHVRTQVGAWARAERARGRGWVDLARRLPVTPTTLHPTSTPRTFPLSEIQGPSDQTAEPPAVSGGSKRAPRDPAP